MWQMSMFWLSLEEGLPFSLLEAMSTECICIATPVGDMGRIITDGQNGFIVAPKDPAGIAQARKN